MLTFDAAQVYRLLDYPSLIAALRAAHATHSMPLTHSHVTGEPPDEVNKFVSLLSWIGGESIAVKLVGVFPGNLSRPVPEPSVQGLVALFDGATGAPLLVADGAAMTFRKTAADSGLGASFLARPDARRLLVVGAGGLAPHVIMAHTAARPSIEHVLVWNRTPARARAVAESVSLPGVAIAATEDLDAAVAEADVISCVTMSTAPLVRGALLKPGAHVDLIGAYLPDMREADDDVARRARVFVDTRHNCTNSGEIADPIAHGILRLEDIAADLFDLCTGRHPGRTDGDAITMYKNVGGAHLDLFTARHLQARATAEAGG
jgi:ornithine cyclodeaminase/alanine dehydrogenase-like protein (mu-crystallin family)